MARTVKWASALLTASLMTSMLVAGEAGARTNRDPHLARLADKPHLPGGAKRLGPVAATRRFTVTIGLAPKDPVGFDAFVNEVTTPGSTNYHHYLKRGEYARRFGPTPRSIAALRASLRMAGFTVAPLPESAQYLKATGGSAAIEQFFHTKMAEFRGEDGTKQFSVTGALRVDQSLKALMTGVSGLGSFNTLSPSTAATRQPHATAPSCQTAADYASSGYGVTTTQLAGAYGLDRYYSAGNTGQGATIGIYELARYKSSDIAAYAACYGITPNIVNVNVDGGPPPYSPSYSAEATEPTLDIDHVISIAPSASVLVYQAPNSTAANPSAPNDLLARIASDDLAQIITTSWGLCEADNPDPGGVNFENGLFKQMAAQGQTFIASSGDNGPADCAGNGSDPVDTSDAVDDPASQPYVTGVGATRTTSFSPLVQSAWGRGSLSGGGSGGGLSAVWPRPAWQQVTSPDSQVTNSTQRMVPDVSLNGDPRSGVLIYQSDQGGWFSIGGTSAASPLFAAVVALEATSCQRNLGFLNPALYAAAQASSANFNDVTSGTSSVGTGTVFAATDGYDLASGLGTPLAGALASVCAAAPSTKSSSTLIGRPTTVGLTFTSPAALTTGDTVTVSWPEGLTLPSSPRSLLATANDDPNALLWKSTTTSASSATPNQATFTVMAPVPAGSLFIFGAVSAINPSEKVPQHVSVTASSASWRTIGASLPSLTGSTSPFATRDVTALNKSLAGKATLGNLTLGSPTTTQVAALGTKVFLATGTAPTLSPLLIGFLSLSKATGTFTGQVQYTKSGSTFILAGISTTGHLLIARTTNVKAKWQVTDLTKSSGLGLAASDALCLSTASTTPVATGAVRLANGNLITFAANSSLATSFTVTNQTSATGLAVTGTPACSGTTDGLVVAVRSVGGDLMVLTVSGATVQSTTNVSATTSLGTIAQAPVSVTSGPLGTAVVATSTSGQVWLGVPNATSQVWTATNLTTSAATGAVVASPIVLSGPNHFIVMGWSRSSHLMVFSPSGPGGLWNAYDATTTWGLTGSSAALRGAASPSSSVLSWTTTAGHLIVTSTSVAL